MLYVGLLWLMDGSGLSLVDVWATSSSGLPSFLVSATKAARICSSWRRLRSFRSFEWMNRKNSAADSKKPAKKQPTAVPASRPLLCSRFEFSAAGEEAHLGRDIPEYEGPEVRTLPIPWARVLNHDWQIAVQASTAFTATIRGTHLGVC